MKGLTVQNQRWSQWVDATTSNVGLLFKGGGYDPRKTGGAPLRFLKCAGLDAAWHETNGRQNWRRGHGMPFPYKFKSDGNVKCARPRRGRWERQRQHGSAAAWHETTGRQSLRRGDGAAGPPPKKKKRDAQKAAP